MKILLIALLLIQLCFSALTPTQIHLAYTGVPSERIVSFVTPDATTGSPAVKYGTSATNLATVVKGTGFRFVAGVGNSYRINTVTMNSLQADTTYYYSAGDASSNLWGPVYSFSTKTSDITYAVYGDFGTANDVSLKRLTEEIKLRSFDAVLHVGDFAYNFQDEDGKTGDSFLENIEPVAATVPYMTCPGNHEAYENFTHYIHRFDNIAKGVGVTSGSETNLWYSFNVDQVHFVVIDTEVYSYSRDQAQIDRQLNWLKQDLILANQQRSLRPWIIMFGHKGWFMDHTNFTGFEDLAHYYGVDVYMCGHVHNYERFYPYYNGKIDKPASKDLYLNPKYMVTLVSGSPGCREYVSHGTGPVDALAFVSKNYGFAHLKVFNTTHLHWQWEQTGLGLGAFEDEFWIVQNRHGIRSF